MSEDRRPEIDEAMAAEERTATITRRVLLGGIGVSTALSLTAAALGATGNAATPEAPPSPAPIRAAASPTSAPVRATPTPVPTHNHEQAAEAAVKAFPAKTSGAGLQLLASQVVNGVREFELDASEVSWEVTPGVRVKALAYNGQLPGPVIRVTEGERVRVRFTNRLAETTGVHWHGLRIPNAMDGVPYITQAPIKPGETFTYEFTAKPVGSHMYHSHHNATDQVGRGLLGPFLVLPKDSSSDPAYDKDELFIFNDSLGGFTVNGKGFPATAPFTARLGQRIRFRFMNEGGMTHPVHLHGFGMQVFARDGYPLAQPFTCDTLNVGPGERWDAIVLADEPGVWAFHCHILSHAEGPSGMFGMVTALIVA